MVIAVNYYCCASITVIEVVVAKIMLWVIIKVASIVVLIRYFIIVITFIQ